VEASELSVVHLSDEIQKIDIGIPGAHQKENSVLAVSLASRYVAFKQPNAWASPGSALPQSVVRGLMMARWPGRCQMAIDPSDASLTWFLDGAHTEESIQCCLEWFVSPEASMVSSSKSLDRILIFNCTKGRSAATFLRVIADTIARQLEKHDSEKRSKLPLFSRVIFCTNTTYADGGFKNDLLSVNLQSGETNLEVQNELASAWSSIYPEFSKDRIHRLPSIEHAVQMIRSRGTSIEKHILVTGSLHLVGGVIEVASLAEVTL